MTWPSYDTWLILAFIALAGASALIIARQLLRRRRAMAGMRYPTGHRLSEEIRRGLRARLVHLPLLLRVVVVALLLVGLSRPQLTSAETAEVEGIDIVVAFDFSGSMSSVDISDEDLVRLQNEGREPKDRFTIATEVLGDFVRSRRYDRVSLVAFGKEAFLMFPLTLDYGVVIRILDQMELGDIDGTATAIGNALAMSLKRLRGSEAKTRLIILLTDGEDNGSNISPKEMAKKAAEDGVHVFPILVGTEDQSRQPTNMRDLITGHRIYQQSPAEVNPQLLEEIAALTDGQFYRAADQQKLEHDFRDILDRFEKSRLVDLAAAERTEIFHWFVLAALALLLLEVLLAQTVLRRFP